MRNPSVFSDMNIAATGTGISRGSVIPSCAHCHGQPQHPMIFSGIPSRADADVGCSSSPRRVVIKVLAEDSTEFALMHKLHGDPRLHVVPVIAWLNAFTVYDGSRMRAVCMPLMSTLAEAIYPGNQPLLECDTAVTSTARQLLQVGFKHANCHGKV